MFDDVLVVDFGLIEGVSCPKVKLYYSVNVLRVVFVCSDMDLTGLLNFSI